SLERMLGRGRGLRLMPIPSLSLGLGQNTAIFSVPNGALLRPPAIARPERLLRILKRSEGNLCSLQNYRDLAAETPSFSTLAAYCGSQVILRRGDSMERV